MGNEVVNYEPKQLSMMDVKAQVHLVQEIMRGVMKEGEHYGVIPGTGTKPSLLKPGAEKLCLTFRLAPDYEITEQKDGDHLTVVSKCTLTHIPSGQRFGAGMGSCSSKETKYAFRQAGRKCPACGKETIIKGKDEYGGGWICFKKKGGCGEKFSDGDPAIEKQEAGKVANDNLADTYNTVLKMANKRSLVAAVLNTTAASDIFTQDIEDMEISASRPKAPAAESDVVKAITNDQAMELAHALAECDDKAEAEFLKIAKLARLDMLPAGDFDEAISWVTRRKAKKAKAA